MEKFNHTLLQNFYQSVMLKKVYASLDELQNNLYWFITYYNFKRTNQEGFPAKGQDSLLEVFGW